MIESLWLQAGPFTYFSTPSPKSLWNAKHHKDIIKALKSGDEAAAAEAISSDILNSAKFLMAAGHFARPPVRNITDLALEEAAVQGLSGGADPAASTSLGSALGMDYQPPRSKRTRRPIKDAVRA
jgi:hypothetical protein